MRERLPRGVYPEQRECARNDNAQYFIKGIACVIYEKACHCEGLFRSNLPLSQRRIGCGFVALWVI
ncbi:MAG: hypothetical protein AYP45_01385 [Candidatus Brocadia carolinensis]|uniref:Uncharacterized protein n=1 Tax=Candidatus Brocadia carolinensis TaxID=1004156 RepID=A0A1V4AXE8_9BACT|nr:MAG: hypothetical protein AYP45_01385 [Candidatus Brocadia caroliniensis]